MNATTQAALIAKKFAAQVVGELYNELSFIQKTNLWRTNTIQENGNFEVPVVGLNLVANDRDGSGNTIDQSPDADTVPVPLYEKHVAFPIDLNWAESENSQMTVLTNLQNAIRVLAKFVHADIFEKIALTAGLTNTGTYGNALTLSDWNFARRTLVTNEANYANFHAVVSPLGMDDLKAIDEFANFNTAGVTGIFSGGQVARANNFTISESPHLYVPAAGQIAALAADFKGVTTVFPKQKLFQDGMTYKIEQEFDGLRFTILQEYVPGKGGSWRWVVMCRYGVAVSDDRLIVLMKGR